MTQLNSKLKLDSAQPIYIGIDVHKEKMTLSFMHQGNFFNRVTIKNNMTDLSSVLKHYQGYKLYSAYEAGFCGFYLHHQLKTLGVENIITPPNKMPVAVGDKVKTDKRDSLKTGVLLSNNMLRAIHIPPEQQVHLRQFMRTRYQMTRKRSAIIHQIKSLLIQYGVVFDKTFSKQDIARIRSMDHLPDPIKLTIGCHLKILECVTEQIQNIEKEAMKAITGDIDQSYFRILKSIPGVGDITAMSLLHEIGDWKRFQNEKQVGAYFGLTPSEYSSGEKTCRGRITGQGSTWLRSLLVEASWILISKDPNMAQVFDRIWKQTGSKKKAIVAIARKLVCRIYSMMKSGQEYKLGSPVLDLKK